MSNQRLMASNTLWNALERFSTLGIQLVCTFLLARFLSASDFGLVGMLVVFTLVGNTITESGFSQALIREPECPQRTLSTIFWTNLGLAVGVYAVLWAMAPWIAAWYRQPLLTDLSRVTFLVIPIGGLSLIHQTMAMRRLQFRQMFLVSATASFISCAVAVVWGWRTHSVWALVVQNVLAYSLRTLGFWLALRWRPTMDYSLAELRRLFTFSRNLLVTGLIGNIFNNIHTILIGRVYGATPAGYFVQADRIRLVASTSATQVVQNVSYPILSRINNESSDERLREAYRRVILTTMTLVGCGMALLMAVSEDLLQLLMGSEDWRISGRFLYALGIAGILFPLHAVNQNILLVKGLGRTVLWVEVARRSLMVMLLLIALHFEVEVFVWSSAAYSFLLVFLNLWVCGRPIGYGLGSQLRDIWPILARLGMMLLMAALANYLLADLLPLPRLALTLTVSILTCLLLFLRGKESPLKQIVKMMKRG